MKKELAIAGVMAGVAIVAIGAIKKATKAVKVVVVDDDLEIAEIAKATGIAVETVAKVVEGHYKYLERLGLMK